MLVPRVLWVNQLIFILLLLLLLHLKPAPQKETHMKNYRSGQETIVGEFIGLRDGLTTMYHHALLFVWVLRIWAQVFMLTQQAPYPLENNPSPGNISSSVWGTTPHACAQCEQTWSSSPSCDVENRFFCGFIEAAPTKWTLSLLDKHLSYEIVNVLKLHMSLWASRHIVPSCMCKHVPWSEDTHPLISLWARHL